MDLVVLPRVRYLKLIQEKDQLTKQVINLEKGILDLKRERESTEKETLELGKKEAEIQEKFQKREAEQKEVLEEFEKTLKEKEGLEKNLKNEEKLVRELKEKVESLQEKLKSTNKAQKENLKRNISKILGKLLPKMEFLGNSVEYIIYNLDTPVLEILREIRFNGGQIDAKRVESAPNFLEKYLGDDYRIYFERPTQNGRIRVLISPKNRQKQDIKYLRSLKG